MKRSRHTALDDPIRELIAKGRIEQHTGRRARRREQAARNRHHGAWYDDSPVSRRRQILQRELERDHERAMSEWL